MSLSFWNFNLASEFITNPISNGENFGEFPAALVNENKISEFRQFSRASEFRIIEICVGEKNSACFKIFPDNLEISLVFWQSFVISSQTRLSITWKYNKNLQISTFLNIQASRISLTAIHLKPLKLSHPCKHSTLRDSQRRLEISRFEVFPIAGQK